MTGASATDQGEYFMPASAHTTEMSGAGLRRGCRGLPDACFAVFRRDLPALTAHSCNKGIDARKFHGYLRARSTE